MRCLSRFARGLLAAALPSLAACSEAPEARSGAVVIVRGGAPAPTAPLAAGAPIVAAQIADPPVALPEEPFDVVADAADEAAQAAARLRDPYRVEDSIVAEIGAIEPG